MATNWKALPDTSTPLIPENLIKDQISVGETEPTGDQDVWIDTANDKIKYKDGSSYTELNVGGVSSYNSLTDKPQINGVELSGNKTLDNIGVPPKSHASTETSYGVGTTANYGHCKVINDLTHSSFANGEALSAYQGKLLNDKCKIIDYTSSCTFPNSTRNAGVAYKIGRLAIIQMSVTPTSSSDWGILVKVPQELYPLPVYDNGIPFIIDDSRTGYIYGTGASNGAGNVRGTVTANQKTNFLIVYITAS